MIRKLFIAALALISATGAIAQSEIAKGDVNLMVVSDLGRNGYYDQKPVAATMGRIAEETGPADATGTMTRSPLPQQWAELQKKQVPMLFLLLATHITTEVWKA